jgi:hypothetical protein
MSQNDIFNKLAIHNRGISGNANTKNNTDFPILSAETCYADGFTEEYLRDYLQGVLGEEAPHIKNYMLSNRAFNYVLGKSIPNTSTKGSYLRGKSGGSLHQQNMAAFLLILGGEIQLVHIALKIIGWSGVKSTFKSIFTENEAQSTSTTGWLFNPSDIICVTTGSGCGESHEFAKDLYGIGGTNSENSYITSAGVADVDSRNTYAGITSRGTGNDPLGYPVALGLHNRLWMYGELLDTIKTALEEYWNTDLTSYTTSDDARTWKLFTAGGASSSVYNSGDLDGTNGYPDALLSGSLNKNMLHISLDIFRQPHSGIDVTEVGIDDGLTIDGNTWKVILNGSTYAYVLLEQESIGAGKYQGKWTIVVRGLATDTPENDPNRSRTPAFKRCGRDFTMTWDSIQGEARFSFYTDSGSELTVGTVGKDLSTPAYFEVSAVVANTASAGIEIEGITD